jgi:hypothetical protein
VNEIYVGQTIIQCRNRDNLMDENNVKEKRVTIWSKEINKRMTQYKAEDTKKSSQRKKGARKYRSNIKELKKRTRIYKKETDENVSNGYMKH